MFGESIRIQLKNRSRSPDDVDNSLHIVTIAATRWQHKRWSQGSHRRARSTRLLSPLSRDGCLIVSARAINISIQWRRFIILVWSKYHFVKSSTISSVPCAYIYNTDWYYLQEYNQPKSSCYQIDKKMHQYIMYIFQRLRIPQNKYRYNTFQKQTDLHTGLYFNAKLREQPITYYHSYARVKRQFIIHFPGLYLLSLRVSVLRVSFRHRRQFVVAIIFVVDIICDILQIL